MFIYKACHILPVLQTMQSHQIDKNKLPYKISGVINYSEERKPEIALASSSSNSEIFAALFVMPIMFLSLIA